MMEIAIKDEEAQRILAQAIRKIIESNTEYYFNQRYSIESTLADAVRSAIDIEVKAQIAEHLKTLKIKEKIAKHITTQMTDEVISDMVRKVNIQVSKY